jgi:hypothetical protein
MVFLPPCTNAWIGLAMYNDTHAFASFFMRVTSLLNSILLPQGDGVSFLTNTCRVNDPDRALALQFHIVHELHPM